MKETKSPTTKRRRTARKVEDPETILIEEPEIPLAEEPEIPLTEEPEIIVLEVKKVKALSTEYEDKILKICSKNKYPFVLKDGSVGRKVPDFINRQRKLIIEVYNPERGEKEAQERVTTFYKYGYRFMFLTKHNLTRADWERFCTGAIKGFLA